MKFTNRLGLPQPIVDAVTLDTYDGPFEEGTFSVTELLSPPRQKQLGRLYGDQLVEDVSDRLWALEGKAIHEVLERAEADGIAEQRLYREVSPGISLTGKFDRVALIKDSGSYVLQDYKYASVWEVIHDAKPERAQQLNMLAWLARYNSYPVTKLQNVMILRDWSMRMAKNDSNYPQTKVAIIDQPVWSDDAIEEFVLERVDAHISAREKLPLCSDEERWMKPPVYAVMKNGNKRAERGGLASQATTRLTTGVRPKARRLETRRASSRLRRAEVKPFDARTTAQLQRSANSTWRKFEMEDREAIPFEPHKLARQTDVDTSHDAAESIKASRETQHQRRSLRAMKLAAGVST